MAKSSKNIKKKSKYSNKTTIKRIKYYYIERVLDEYTQFSTSSQFPFFFWSGKMKYPKNWVGAAIFKKICRGNQKEEGRENAKVIGR